MRTRAYRISERRVNLTKVCISGFVMMRCSHRYSRSYRAFVQSASHRNDLQELVAEFLRQSRFREINNMAYQTPPRLEDQFIASSPTSLTTRCVSVRRIPGFRDFVALRFFKQPRDHKFFDRCVDSAFFKTYKKVFIGYLHSIRFWKVAVSQGVERSRTMNRMTEIGHT